MNRLDSLPTDVWELFNAKLDGTLTDDGVKQLERLLDGDFGLQSLFRNYCQLHINLSTEMRAQRVVDTLRDGSLICRDRVAIEPSSLASRAPAPSLPDSRPRSRRRALTWGLAASAAVLVVVAGWQATRPRVPRSDPWPPAVVANAEIDLDVITVRLASNESRYLPIGKIGKLHIQGPAHLDLIGTSRARLYDGRIKVRIIDPRGRGFVVETPQGNVIDLGTEFGVEVNKGSDTGVVVFEGAVDLAVPTAGANRVQIERLVQGEGLNVNEAGHMDRIMTVVTGKVPTFQRRGELRPNGALPVIVDVFDNIRSPELRKFYEIVPGGMCEDALAYVDRPAHDWSGTDQRGIPEYLVGADYVKPFNSDKLRSDMEISVTLSCPARLFIFADDRVAAPPWLRTQFRDTGDSIGHDCGPYVLDGVEFFKLNRGFGPGNSVDSTFSIWEKIVERPGVIKLGPNFGKNWEFSAMYGIAAVRLDTEPPATQGDQPTARKPQ